MQYIEKTNKSVDEVVKTIQEKASEFKFGVLHIHNIKETLNNKGLDFEEECQVLDVCNPGFAKKLLTEDMTTSTILPCKISVYAKNGEVFIGMNSVVNLITSVNEELRETAKEIEETLLSLINTVK
eukprot:TRINITY_DN223637_c0_g1_i1.p2 TRINITY_DN223637_c0_g1~~TRINITY_DN223637_c0_g1_i1.p2  ORF type:complete len:126 (+),score=24.68 TRINITY_DN223637_c0_g1_i1:619-996(+)